MRERGSRGVVNGLSECTSRREFLKAAGALGAALGAGVFTSSCSGGLGGSSDVTLSVSTEGPYGPMPTKEERKASVGDEAYAQALQAWLDKNPGVSLKRVAVDIWDQETMTTALAGGTAPAAFVSNVIGGWGDAGIRSAFLQGLAADVTELVKDSKLIGRLADYAKPLWEQTWTVNGSYYAGPSSYNVGDGIHYRRDLIEELGLKLPTPDWTWSDVRELAAGMTEGKRKGIALQDWGLENIVSAEGFGLLTTLPAPDTSWNWRWDYAANVDYWAQIIGEMRAMRFDDKSVLADIAFGDGEIWNAFIRGEACMHLNNVVYYTSSPTSDTTHMTLAKNLEKPLEEVVGWMPLPMGRNGYGASGVSQGQIDSVSFSPDLDDDELAAAFDLYLFMVGEGFVSQTNFLYDKTNDLKQVYSSANITPVLRDSLENMPGSPDEAWGKEFMDTIRAATAHPLIPVTAWYIPAEDQTGPTSEAIDDAFSKWFFEPGRADAAGDLRRTEEVRNSQTVGFTSSVPDEEFVTDARKYYEAHERFWRAHSPTFYEEAFRDWYEQKVLPALDA